MRLSLFAEIFNMLLMTIILGVAVYLLVLIVKALKKYINSKEIREEKRTESSETPLQDDAGICSGCAGRQPTGRVQMGDRSS